MKLNRFEHLLSARAKPHLCDHEGCSNQAEFRAPRSRAELREFNPSNFNTYYWFCQDHIRDYNLQWNYYSGMDAEAIEEDRYDDVTWNRPTWQFAKGPRRYDADWKTFDKFKIFTNDEKGVKNPARGDPKSKSFPFNSAEARALKTLSVPQPATEKEVKRAYKLLAKRHHPDATGGDKKSEERLKQINQAYQVLKGAF